MVSAARQDVEKHRGKVLSSRFVPGQSVLIDHNMLLKCCFMTVFHVMLRASKICNNYKFVIISSGEIMSYFLQISFLCFIFWSFLMYLLGPETK